MRKIGFILLSALLVFASCEEEQKKQLVSVGFDDIDLGESGYWIGSDKKGGLIDGVYHNSLTSGVLTFSNKYEEAEWGSTWSGFAVSSHTDTVTSGWLNQYSTIAGTGFSESKQFALVYDTATITLSNLNGDVEPVSMMLTNSTYTYKDIKDGGDFTDKFEDGDWFKVIIQGYNNSVLTGSIDFYLADFRNGKTELVREWTRVDLSKLGKPTQITFGFASSDVGERGMNTPAYVCVDHIVLATLPSGK